MPAIAVALAMAKATDTGPSRLPTRFTVNVTVPMVWLTVTALVENCAVGSACTLRLSVADLLVLK